MTKNTCFDDKSFRWQVDNSRTKNDIRMKLGGDLERIVGYHMINGGRRESSGSSTPSVSADSKMQKRVNRRKEAEPVTAVIHGTSSGYYRVAVQIWSGLTKPFGASTSPKLTDGCGRTEHPRAPRRCECLSLE